MVQVIATKSNSGRSLAGDSEPTVDPSRATSSPSPVGWDLPVVLVGVVGVVLVASLATISDLLPAAVAAAVVAVAALTVALRSFWHFTLFVIVARPIVDAFSRDQGGLEPSAGFVLAVTALTGLWLVARVVGGRRLKLSAPTGWVLVLMSAIALSSVVAASFPSFVVATKIASAVLLLVALEQLFDDDPTRIVPALRAVVVSAIVPAALALVQTQVGGFDVGYHPIGVAERVKGSFVHPSVLAGFCVVVLLVCFIGREVMGSRLWRGTATVMGLVMGGLLVLTYTRGAWIAAIVAAVYVAVVLKPRLLIGIAAIVIIVAVAVPSIGSRFADLRSETDATTNTPNSMAWRFNYWERILPLGAAQPLTGIGIGMTRQRPGYDFEPHSIYVQSFVESGVVATAALAGVVGSGVMAVRRTRKRGRGHTTRRIGVLAGAVGVAYLVQGLTDNLLTQLSIIYPFLVPIAWAFAASRSPDRFALPADAGPHSEGTAPQDQAIES